MLSGLALVPGWHVYRARLWTYSTNLNDFFHPPASSDEITCLRFATDGSLWVGTEGGFSGSKTGVRICLAGRDYQPTRESCRRSSHRRDKERVVEWDGVRLLEREPSISCIEGRSDIRRFRRPAWNKVVCTLAGLARREHGRIEEFGQSASAESSEMAHNRLRAEHAYEDDQGTMWVQFAGCLYRSPPAYLSRWSTVPFARSLAIVMVTFGQEQTVKACFASEPVSPYVYNRDGLPNNIPMAVLSRHDGSLWVGTNCGGVSVYANRRFRTYSEKDGLLNSCVWSLAEVQQEPLAWHLGRRPLPLSNNHFTRFTKREVWAAA